MNFEVSSAISTSLPVARFARISPARPKECIRFRKRMGAATPQPELQKLTCRLLVSPDDTPRAASVLITRAENLRDSQGGQEDGRSARKKTHFCFRRTESKNISLERAGDPGGAVSRRQREPKTARPRGPPVLPYSL